MIRSLPIHSTQASAAQPTRTTASGSTARTTSFHNVLQPALTAGNKAAPTSTGKPVASTPSDDVPHLGPFSGDPNTRPAVAAPRAPAPVTSSPYLPAGYQGDTDLMNKTQHEQTMNDWLQNYTKWSNDNKTQIYQQAMINWQLNDQRCQELGIASPPKPTPPTLDPVQPMPTGYWFNNQT